MITKYIETSAGIYVITIPQDGEKMSLQDATIIAQDNIINSQNDFLFQARGEIRRLTARLADYQADAARVLSGECAPDEKHCSCVPTLRSEIERLRGALKMYADSENWQPCQSDDGSITDEWMGDGEGYNIARSALEGGPK